MATKGISVKLKTKKLKDNRHSFYLQYYFSENRERKKDYLSLYLIDKPKNDLERQQNKETKRIAESVYAKRLVEIQEGRFGFNSNPKPEFTFLAHFETCAEKRSASASNYSNWMSTLLHLKKFPKSDCKLSEINYIFLEELKKFFVNEKLTKSNTKLSQNSCHTYFNKVIASINEAYVEGLIEVNPIKKIKAIKPAEVQREFLSEEEIQLLFNTDCKAARIKNSFLFGVLTGLRFSDIQNLEWKDLHQNEKGWYIRFVQKKTKKTETLFINQEARNLLGERGEDNDRIFKGLKYSAHNNHLLLSWCKDAGIKKHITFHTSRHTHACLLLAKGVDIYTVSKILGHKELKTTQIYAKVIDQNKIDAISKIPNFSL